MGWASEEFETIDLGDKRLNKRAALLAERLVDSPSASIPKACQGWKETQAAYRLISNDAVSAEAIAELVRYCEHGQLRISNVLAENAIRPFAVGRKAWLCVSRRRTHDEIALSAA